MTISLPADVQKRFDVLVSLGDRDGGQNGSARAVYELLHGLCVEVYRERLPSAQDDACFTVDECNFLRGLAAAQPQSPEDMSMPDTLMAIAAKMERLPSGDARPAPVDYDDAPTCRDTGIRSHPWPAGATGVIRELAQLREGLGDLLGLDGEIGNITSHGMVYRVKRWAAKGGDAPPQDPNVVAVFHGRLGDDVGSAAADACSFAAANSGFTYYEANGSRVRVRGDHTPATLMAVWREQFGRDARRAAKGGDAPQEPSLLPVGTEPVAAALLDHAAELLGVDSGMNIQPGCSCGHEWTLWKCSHLVPNDALSAERTWGRPPGGAEALLGRVNAWGEALCRARAAAAPGPGPEHEALAKAWGRVKARVGAPPSQPSTEDPGRDTLCTPTADGGHALRLGPVTIETYPGGALTVGVGEHARDVEPTPQALIGALAWAVGAGVEDAPPQRKRVPLPAVISEILDWSPRSDHLTLLLPVGTDARQELRAWVDGLEARPPAGKSPLGWDPSCWTGGDPDEPEWSLYELYSVARERESASSERYGQALYNTLRDVRPDIIERLAGTHDDPFNAPDGSERMTRAITVIESMWGCRCTPDADLLAEVQQLKNTAFALRRDRNSAAKGLAEERREHARLRKRVEAAIKRIKGCAAECRALGTGPADHMETRACGLDFARGIIEAALEVKP